MRAETRSRCRRNQGAPDTREAARAVWRGLGEGRQAKRTVICRARLQRRWRPARLRLRSSVLSPRHIWRGADPNRTPALLPKSVPPPRLPHGPNAIIHPGAQATNSESSSERPSPSPPPRPGPLLAVPFRFQSRHHLPLFNQQSPPRPGPLVSRIYNPGSNGSWRNLLKQSRSGHCSA